MLLMKTFDEDFPLSGYTGLRTAFRSEHGQAPDHRRERSVEVAALPSVPASLCPGGYLAFLWIGQTREQGVEAHQAEELLHWSLDYYQLVTVCHMVDSLVLWSCSNY